MSGLFPTPELGPDTLTARPYQLDAIEAVRSCLRRGVRSCLVIHPTGTGKTVLMSKVCRMAVEKGNRVLILAHREELITQSANVLDRVGIVAGIEKASSKAREAFDAQVVVASVQTMQGKRLESWPRDHFSLVLADEAHHFTSPSFRRPLDHFSGAKIVGVTATPDRSDGESLASVFAEVAHELTIWEMMTAPDPGPYLCRLEFHQLDVDIDLRGIRKNKDDFNLDDLRERIAPMIGTLANAIRQKIGERPTLVFTPDVASASAMATAMSSIGMSAQWVSGDCPDRAEKVAAYSDGSTQVLVNCQLLTEGFDAPRTAAIALCRPTQSRSLYSQMVGRGTRLYPSKPNCQLIDFNYLTDEHDLVRPADLFTRADGSDEVRKITEAILAEGNGQDLIEVVEKAKVQAEDERQRRIAIELKAREREIKYRRETVFDPLDPSSGGSPRRHAVSATHERPSPKQVGYLVHHGYRDAAQFSKRYAGRLIGILKQKEGLSVPASAPAGFFDGHA